MSRADKAILFDLDGTLLDTIGDLAAAVNASLSKNGFPERTVAEVKSFIGNGSLVLMSRAAGVPADGAQCALLRRDFISAYRASLCVFTKPYPGMPELVGRLHSAGVKLAVVSNKDDDCVKKLISSFFGECFDAARGTLSQSERKPDPSVTLGVISSLGTEPRRCAFVGDGRADAAVSKNAGVPFIPVGYGYTDPEALLALSGVSPARDVNALSKALEVFLNGI